MLHLEEKTDLNPLFPHCQQALNVMYYRELESFLGMRYVYFYPFCKEILGIAHLKDFWMG